MENNPLKKTIRTRTADQRAISRLVTSGEAKRVATILAARGVHDLAEMRTSLADMLPFHDMKGIAAAASALADAIRNGSSILIVADYDSDGATACAVGVRGLRKLGAKVDFMVPNRFTQGYGLTPEIARLAAERSPDILLTVDNGIASVDGVAEANRLGMRVIVTDHHLPGERLPDALAIVNPNQPGCPFPSKNLAGVGVMFYVLIAVRAELRKRGMPEQDMPNMLALMDLVSIGTVADVVQLDRNNRILVDNGLRNIRNGATTHGVLALLEAARRDHKKASVYDLGFALGPRLNAAGRLEDMTIGIRCLLSDDPDEAKALAQELDALNSRRREIEGDMKEEAEVALGDDVSSRHSICIHQDNWHQGVIGIVASRIKDQHNRPTIVFATADDGTLKGSGRSIKTLHLRDAIDLVAKRHPGLIVKFGGHAMAAGLTIKGDLDTFASAFEKVCAEKLTPADLDLVIESDGDLSGAEISFELAEKLAGFVWGQGFPQPLFHGRFSILETKIVGEKHLRLTLEKDGEKFSAMRFFSTDIADGEITYALDINEFRDKRSLQLIVRDVLPD